MKGIPLLLMAGLALLSFHSQAAQTAQSRMYCLSLRMQGADDQNGFYHLDFTTLNAGVNGELAPDFVFLQSGYTNSAYIVFTDLIFDEKFNGGIGLDLPAGVDADANGFPDFFEVSKSVSATTDGAYSIQNFGSGPATAQWYRDAGFSSGLCILTLQSGFQNLCFLSQFRNFGIHRASFLYARSHECFRKR